MSLNFPRTSDLDVAAIHSYNLGKPHVWFDFPTAHIPMFLKAQPKCLSLMLLTVLPFVAHAEQHLTYRCDGIESSNGGDIHTREHITRFYTLYLAGSGGRWFNWDEHLWYPIHSISEDTFQLASDSDRGPSWTLSIERVDGTWNQVYAGGGGTTSTAGKCTIVTLRIPSSS
jgi:hypothetical protein